MKRQEPARDLGFLRGAVFSLAIAVTTFQSAANEETVELKSTDGKIIEAQIMRMYDKSVKIRRGRKDFDVPLDKFSAETQAMLKEWAKVNVRYSFSVGRAAKQLRKSGASASYGYEVTLDNRSGLSVEDLTISYQIYNTRSLMRRGSVKLPKLLNADDFVFTTIAGSNTLHGRLSEAGPSTSTRTGSVGNHLGGLWIKITNKEGKVIFEDKNLITKVKGATWSG